MSEFGDLVTRAREMPTNEWAVYEVCKALEWRGLRVWAVSEVLGVLLFGVPSETIRRGLKEYEASRGLASA